MCNSNTISAWCNSPKNWQPHCCTTNPYHRPCIDNCLSCTLHWGRKEPSSDCSMCTGYVHYNTDLYYELEVTRTSYYIVFLIIILHIIISHNYFMHLYNNIHYYYIYNLLLNIQAIVSTCSVEVYK